MGFGSRFGDVTPITLAGQWRKQTRVDLDDLSSRNLSHDTVHRGDRSVAFSGLLNLRVGQSKVPSSPARTHAHAYSPPEGPEPKGRELKRERERERGGNK